MEKFGIYGKLIAKEGERERLTTILLEAAESTKNLDDCELSKSSVIPLDSYGDISCIYLGIKSELLLYFL